jgi:murein hydrolase activator
MTARNLLRPSPGTFWCTFALVLTLGLGLAGPIPAQANETREYEAQLRQLQENIQRLQRELESVQGTRDELREQLQKSESEIGELLRNIERIEKQLKKQEQDLQSLHRERSELQLARNEQQQEVSYQMQAAYQLGRQSQIKLLLNQESPERVSRILRYYDYLLEARNEKIQSYLTTLDRLDQIEPQITAQTHSLEQNRSALRERHSELSLRQQERRETLAALNNRITSADQELTQMQGDRERLEQLLDEMTSAIANLSLPEGDHPFSNRKGRLPWPTDGTVQHRFGSSQFAEKMQWNGIVIRAPAGQAVLAVHHGRVVFSDYFRGHGLLLIVDHGEGFMTLYAHNQSLFKETGEWVSAGERIASVGNTGGRQNAGLYFEIRHNGRPTDPSGWLARA